MDSFCGGVPSVHGDFIGDAAGDLWRTCGYLRSPSPPPPPPPLPRDDLASLRAAGVHRALDDDDDERPSSDIDVYYDQHLHLHHHLHQQQQQQRDQSPIDDIADEPMFSFSARAPSKPYR